MLTIVGGLISAKLLSVAGKRQNTSNLIIYLIRNIKLIKTKAGNIQHHHTSAEKY